MVVNQQQEEFDYDSALNLEIDDVLNDFSSAAAEDKNNDIIINKQIDSGS